MLNTTTGQLLLNEALPEDLRDYTRVWDKKGTAKVYQSIAERYPEKYREIAKKLQDIGRMSATESGGYSFGINAFRVPPKTAKLKQEIQNNVDNILRSNLDDDAKQKAIISYIQSKTKTLEEGLYQEASENKNPLALQVMSGARGNPGNLRSVMAGDMLYEDHVGDIIPIPVLNSYAKGLSPVEYWAGTFGTRRGVYLLKAATSDAGFFGKQLNQATHRLIVTKHDADKEDENVRGVVFPTDDNDNEGALLAQPAAGYKRNTVLTPKILADIKSKGIDNILVRSPLTGGPPEGGLYARDVGVRERGGFSPIGDAVGQSAGSALCLEENELVRMADFSVKAIKDICPGEYVLSADKYGSTFSVRVKNVYNNGLKECYETFFYAQDDSGRKVSIKSTLDHRILLAHTDKCSDVNLGDIKLNDLWDINYNVWAFCPTRIVTDNDYAPYLLKFAKQVYIGRRNTYDIEVAHPDHLYVLASGLITHNSEPLTQASISSKHTGGVAGAGGAAAGFKVINQLAQVPKTFTGGAAHAQLDGKVGAIYDAPAGGKYVMVGGKRHYVATGFEPTVKFGDIVEAGDVISDGLPNPAELVKHKGVGEGRRAFVDIFRKTFKASNIKAHRRNIELVARGLINHVKLNEEMGDYVPDDIVPYDVLEHAYQPRDGNEVIAPNSAIGKFLEKPVLHYSIGTQVKPNMLKNFNTFGVTNVTVHKDPPPFEPHMVRAMENLVHDPDWMTRQFGTNLRKGFLRGAHRGAVSDEAGTSFVPALARAKDYGRSGLTKTWDPKSIIPAT